MITKKEIKEAIVNMTSMPDIVKIAGFHVSVGIEHERVSATTRGRKHWVSSISSNGLRFHDSEKALINYLHCLLNQKADDFNSRLKRKQAALPKVYPGSRKVT